VSQSTPDEESITFEETGLNLFDDAASVAGTFPGAVLGYDKARVDSYVRDLERQLSTLKQLARHQRREMRLIQENVGTTEFAHLGAHIKTMLGNVEAQGKDIVAQAGIEAERIKEEGRRFAADLRSNAQTEADDIRVAGLANLRQLREQLDAEVTVTLDRAKAEAASALAAAQRHADAVRIEAERTAGAAVEAAGAEAARIVQSAEREAADVKLAARTEAERLLTEARAHHSEVQASTAALLADATRHHADSAANLAQEATDAQRIRSEALARAEEAKVGAARDAEATIAASHRQSAMMKERLEEQYAWRKEQLEREVAALLQRRSAIVAELTNLHELAGRANVDYPGVDPFVDADATEVIPTTE